MTSGVSSRATGSRPPRPTQHPALDIIRRKITELSPDPANARKHGDKNLQAIKSSLRRFGQQKPLVVDGNGVVRAGNGTLAAALDLGWEEVDVVISSLTEAELIAYGIADNRSAELAGWDDDVLAALLQCTADSEKGLEGTGFDEAAMHGLLEGQEAAKEGDGDLGPKAVCPSCERPL